MKNLFLTLVFMLVGTFAFAQCNCTTADGGGCSVPASCKSAHCSTVEGECVCDCYNDLKESIQQLAYTNVGDCNIIRESYIEEVTGNELRIATNENQDIVSRFEKFELTIAKLWHLWLSVS